MLGKLTTSAARQANRLLRYGGVKIVRVGPRPLEDYRDYIAFAPTLARATEAGLSVGDYIDLKHNRPGATQETIDRLVAMGALHAGIRRICEIGPGSGRYLERTLAVCHPDYYEIYETAADWRDYLKRTHGVVAQPADGSSLSSTPSASVDLVHAHKVLPGQSFLVTYRYLLEMARVVAPGGKVVFDVVTESCMDEATVNQWLTKRAGYQCYPALMPRHFAIDVLVRLGLTFDGGFEAPMKPGRTECLVFTRPRDGV